LINSEPLSESTPHTRKGNPTKTDSWDVQAPAFSEVDLVSHSGNSAEGEFAHTLNLTDIHTGGTESRALLGKSEIAVPQALNEIQAAIDLPLLFPFLALESPVHLPGAHRQQFLLQFLA